MARQRLLLLVAVIVLTTWLPYLFGWWLTPPGTNYFWLIYNPDDQNVHLMWARQAMDGKFLFRDLFTTEPHPGLFTNLFILLLGWFCRLTGISLHFGYQIFRTASALAFLLTAYWFSGLFLRNENTRLSFLLLLGFSSGFGWLLVLWWWLTGQRPPFFLVDVSPELTMPEANSFLSLTVAPLATLGVTLVMAALGCLMWSSQTERDKSMKFFTLSVLFGMLVVNVHTYAALPMLFAVFVWQIFQAVKAKRLNFKELTNAALFVFLIISLLGGQALLFSRDPAFAQKAATPTLTPNPIILIGSYGFIALGALYGLVAAFTKWKSGEDEWAVLIAWLISIAVFVYLPVSFQRKMIEGLHVILCLLTALAVERMAFRDENETFKRGDKKTETVQPTRRLHAYTIAILIVSLPSQFAFFALNGYWLVHNNIIYDERFNPPYSRMLMPPYYLSVQHLKLFRWLEQHTQSDEAILCHPMLGNYIPVLTGRKVFLGHWAETLNFGEKLKIAMAIWKGRLSPDEAKNLFRQHKIRYAVETDFEQGASGGQCELHRYGEVLFQINDDRVFKLNW